MDYAPKDYIISTTFPWSSSKTSKELAKLKSEMIVLMNEAILSQKPVVPDGGEDGSYVYTVDGIVANFNMLDASRYDAENLTITDTIHGLTAQLYGVAFDNTALTELPTIRDNSATAASVYFSANPLSEYISADNAEFTLEWSQYRYADDTIIPADGFMFRQNGFRIAAYGNVAGRYLQSDGATYANVGDTLKAAGYKENIISIYLNNRNAGVHVHSIAAFASDGTVRLYRNGVKTVEAVMPDFNKWDPLVLTDAFRMGGYCRSMRIYSRVLTDDEVLNNYNYEKQFIV